MRSIYLDHNGTTPMNALVKEAFLDVLGPAYNASSIHSEGRKARGILEAARKAVLTMADAPAGAKLVFTASGTEANSLAIRGLDGRQAFVSAIEHPSVLRTGVKNEAVIVPVTAEGTISLEALEKLLQHKRKAPLISIMLANNETGIIQPVKEVVALAQRYGGLVHTDAVQGFGKMPVSFKELGVDLMTISAHKFGGPQGAAALIVRDGLTLNPQLLGGGQEQGWRSGTENVAAIHAFGIAARLAAPQWDISTQALRDQLEQQIQAFAPETLVIGQNQPRLPNTSLIAMRNVTSETQLIHFDTHGIALSAGSACSSGKIEASHVLRAMQIPDEVSKTVIRVSLGQGNTEADIQACITAWQQLYTNVNKEKAA